MYLTLSQYLMLFIAFHSFSTSEIVSYHENMPTEDVFKNKLQKDYILLAFWTLCIVRYFKMEQSFLGTGPASLYHLILLT